MEAWITKVKRAGRLICGLLLIVSMVCTTLAPVYAEPADAENEFDPDSLDWTPVYFPEDEYDRPETHGAYYINITMAFYRYMEESRAYYEAHPEETIDWPEEEYEDRIKYRAMMHLESIRHSLEEDVHAEYYICPDSPDPQYRVKKVTVRPEGNEINYFPRDAVEDLYDESQYVMESHDYIDDPKWTWVDEETAYADFICYYGVDPESDPRNPYADGTNDYARVYAEISREVITEATELTDGEMKCTATVLFPDPLTFLDRTFTNTKIFTIPATENPERVTITEQPQSQDLEWPDGAILHVAVDKPELVASYQWIMQDWQGTSFVLNGSTATTDTLVLPAADVFVPLYDLHCIVTDINGNKTISDTARLTITNESERKMVLFVCDHALEPGESLDLSDAGLGSGTIAFHENGTEATLSNAVINSGAVRFDSIQCPSQGILVEGGADGYDTFYLHIEGDCIINDELQDDSGNGVALNGHFRSSERPDVFPLFVIDGEGTLTLNGGSVSLNVDSDLELDADLTTHPLEKDNCTGIAARNLHLCPGTNTDINCVGDGMVLQNILYVQEANLHINAINHLSNTANSEAEGILIGGKIMSDNAVIDIDINADPERILPAGRVIAHMYGIRSNSTIELYGTKLSIDAQAEPADVPYANNFCGITGDYFDGLLMDDESQVEIRIKSDEIIRAAGITTDSNDYGSGISIENGSVLDIDIQTAGDVVGIDMPNRISVTDSTLKVNTSSADGGNVYALHAPSLAIEMNDTGNEMNLRAENGVAVFLNDEDSAGTEYDPEYTPSLFFLNGYEHIVTPQNGVVSSYGYPIFGNVFPGETVYDPSDTTKPASEVVIGISVEDAKEAVAEAQAEVNALTEDATAEEIKTAYEKLVKAQNILNGALETLQKTKDAISEEEQEKLKEEITGLEEEIASLEKKLSDLEEKIANKDQEIQDLKDQLAEARVIDISNYAVTLAKTTYEYTAKAIKPSVKVSGLTSKDYTVTYKNNTKIGTAKVIITAKGNKYKGQIIKTFKITKRTNPLSVKGKTATVRYSTIKTKSQTLKTSLVIQFVNKGRGILSYAKVSGNSKIIINKTTGKVTVKKGLKKGTYKVKVKVKAAGTAAYKASAWKTVTFTIRVK